ncbi:asparagine synthase (glutamine-hydrolyzing) [Epilithonimonas arachidiradicis]|uniref:asparagine synthase (glutamine-hydrolyzing) n=1 Tax=Epilithonimonas arachidiradicis TaxID=1617282 RepID=A0A420DEB7_9FLAO|nr:asparagine synthase (glutamine-hydrolyzing) [Epilithonimonas arachidiradicis]RKE89899.1 asparagine synthase (glutamine-hydrolysing) [Epilithonimonas arachidiradicis]GGG46160.1 asparagine synthetase B [Epilithonimonas arachidiradicis]
MCGIAGIVKKNIFEENSYRDTLKKMTDSIIHRGPDDEGHEFFQNCFLGFRRLAIVDLSSDGHQPMYSNTKNECIVFNGEIYGYRDLKTEISDYPFKSNTDTEVILSLYQKSGFELPQQLNGMFSLAIWDEAKQQLFCARDRFGEKPFYYAIGKNGEFIFASEIKAILATNLIDAELNDEAIYHFLRHMYVNSQQSIYKNINVLPPAHQLVYKDGEIEISQYWNFPNDELQISEEEAIKNFKKLVEKSVEKQLVADVKVGAFLSGGLDSGTLVALSANKNQNLTTLGFQYQGDWDEMPDARSIAGKYKTDHKEVGLQNSEIPQVLVEVLKKMDEPIADTAILATYTICKEAAKNMTVVITGNAGDELFGGYGWYQKEQEILEKGSANSALLPLYKIGSTVSEKLGLEKQRQYFLDKIFRSKFPDIVSYQKGKVHNNFSNEETSKLLTTNKNYEHQYFFNLDKNNLNTCLKMDLTNVIPGDYLVKDDRIAMMHSIELRTPFLDKNLVEFCSALPTKYKVNSSQTKIILRKAFGDLLTSNILNKKKQGFGAPIADWLKITEMEDLTTKILKNSTSKIFNKLNFDEVQKQLNYNYKHWSLLVLGIWMEEHS